MPDLLIVPLSQLRLSRFNARRQRPEAQVTRLAQRMQRNGFEISRALWAYANNGHYEVFAGGTRLAAAKEAGLPEVPILLYPADDEAQISRLADQDNENDEYHVPVPLPDIWAEYKRLQKEEGWTQDRIATSKMVNQATVSQRLHFALFPLDVISVFIKHDFLKEDHARELLKLLKFNNFTPWLTRDQAMTEILDGILDKHRGKNGEHAIPPTASVFSKSVATWNTMVKAAEEAIDSFPDSVATHAAPYIPHDAFLQALAVKEVRTTKDVLLTADSINSHCAWLEQQRLARLADEQRRLTAEQQAAEERAAALEQERQRHAYRDSVLRRLEHGDCRTLIPQHCPENVNLVLTDPPYGKQFQSHRRVSTKRKEVVKGDTSLEEAVQTLREALTALLPKLASDAHLFICAHQDSYRAFCQVIEDVGLTLRRTMTWLKGNHGLGDTTRGEVLTETEWIIHAVQGNPKFTDGIDRSELLDFAGEQDSEHPMEKPVALLRHLITLATEPGDVVVDPFAGTANTLLAILAEYRLGWACELDEDFYRDGSEKLYKALTESLAL